jgi:alanine racemase
MVKADAYGHGALAVSRVALANGADWLAVALPEEGRALRNAGISSPIIVLGPVLPAQIPLVVDAELQQAIFTWEVAEALDVEAARRDRRVIVHVEIDTGMGRTGLPAREAIDFLQAVQNLQHLTIQGIYTHFATADSEDKAFTHQQMQTLMEICRESEKRGVSIPMRHLSNSAAILDLPETFRDLVRPGLIIYGCYPSEAVQRTLKLRPAMCFKTSVIYVKDLLPGESVSYGRTFIAAKPMRVATLPLGYADGFSRHLSNRGEVLIRGARASVIGVVCMDMVMVDVTHIPRVTPGDEVVIFGRQDDCVLSVEEIAQRSSTISYEILCAVGARVPRVYLEDEA